MLEVMCVDSYEKIINTIRNEARRDKSKQLYVGDMTGTTTCILNGLDLDADDFLISERLVNKLKAGDEVLVCKVKSGENETFVIVDKVVKV